MNNTLGYLILVGLISGATGWVYLTFKMWKKMRETHPDRMSSDTLIVTDLDRMISKPVGFRWNGRIHKIRPMTNETFLRVINELAKMDAAYKSENKDEEVIVRLYHGLFSSVCDTISYKDVKKMSYAQVAALFKEIVACVTGKAHVEDMEKKTLKMA